MIECFYMENYYLGHIGKEFSYTLISETPFIVHIPEEGEFEQCADLREALKYLDSSSHTVYAFDAQTGTWVEVNFAPKGTGSTKKSVGFVAH